MKIFVRKYSKIILVIAALCIFSLFAFLNVFGNYELLFYDFLFKVRPPLATNQNIVIIEISDDTLQNLGTWPLPRDFHASVIDVLREFQAKMVIFDMFFSEPSVYDQIFAESLKRAGNVFLPRVYDIDSRMERGDGLPKAKGVIVNTKQLDDVTQFAGHINTFVDADGKIRRVPLFIEYNAQQIPHLALRAACIFFGLDVENVSFQEREVIIDNQLRLPVTSNNSFFVNYPATWAASFTHLSYFDVLKSYKDLREGRDPLLDLTTLKDKICIIGLTASGTPEIRAIPLEASYPLVGLQASVLNSILEARFIKKIAPLFSVILVVLSFLFALGMSLRYEPLRACITIIVSSVLYSTIAALLFIFQGIWCDIFLVLLTLGVVYVSATIYKFLDEIKRRELLEKELNIARDIQKSFLPKEMHEFKSLAIASLMQPAKYVAGDLYDIIELDEHKLGVFIGDVSGKGVSAALIMAQTVSLLRVFSRRHTDPAEVLTQLNKELSDILLGKFVTAMYLVIDTKRRLLQGSCAGHHGVLVYSAHGDAITEFLPVSGPPLGIMGSISYESFQKPIEKGEKFLLYTDGISEARNRKEEEFGLERIKEILMRHRDVRANELVGILKKAVIDFHQGRVQYDDITVLLLDCSDMV